MQPRDAKAAGARGAGRAIRPAAQALVAVGAAICAIAPGAAASRVSPTPAPLWQAYPLDGQVRPDATSTIDRADVAESGRDRPDANRSPRPVALTGDPGRDPLRAAVLGVLAGLAFALALMAVPAARGPVSRWLARARGARPGAAAVGLGAPSRVPVVSAAKTLLALESRVRTEADPVAVPALPPAEREQCEIVWWTSDDGAQFRAIGRNRAGRRYVAARSPAVGDPRPAMRDGETLEAWQTLVARLHKRGWTPQGPVPSANGTPWYAQRFERPRRPAREPARAAGGRA